jgi:hypothetical protein
MNSCRREFSPYWGRGPSLYIIDQTISISRGPVGNSRFRMKFTVTRQFAPNSPSIVHLLREWMACH